MTATPAYIIPTRTRTGWKGTVILNGERRWTREARTGAELADALCRCCPGIDHVQCEAGILDTGCLSLGEAIEASAGYAVPA